MLLINRCHVSLVCAACQLVNFVVLNGNRYAALDNTLPSQTGAGSQSLPLGLPAGWNVCPNTTDAVTAAKTNPWGTECLVLADGTAAPSSQTDSCALNAQLVSANGAYRPKQARIFVSQSATVGNLPNAAPGLAAGVTTVAALIFGAGLVFLGM